MIALRRCLECREIFDAEVGSKDLICEDCRSGKKRKNFNILPTVADSWYNDAYVALGYDAIRTSDWDEDDKVMYEVENEISDFGEEIEDFQEEMNEEAAPEEVPETVQRRPQKNYNRPRNNKPKRNNNAPNRIVAPRRKNPYQ